MIKVPQLNLATSRVANVAMPGIKGAGLAKALGIAGKVGGFLGAPGVGLGISLLGGLIGARRKSRQSTVPQDSNLMALAGEIEGMDLQEFQDIAREAAPSYQDVSRLAAATGGSQAAASSQFRAGQTGAMDMALRAYRQQQVANQGLLANIYGQQFAGQQADLMYQRQTGVDIFSNIANLSAGLLGQRYGARLQSEQNQNLFNVLNQYKSPYGT